MPKLGLRPYSVIEEGAEAYFGYNFMRIENVHEHMTDVKGGVALVTGGITLETGLANLDTCVASMATNPQVGAAFVSCNIQSPTSIYIGVYTSTFATSTLPVYVRWVAVGELILT